MMAAQLARSTYDNLEPRQTSTPLFIQSVSKMRVLILTRSRAC
jgi:hypothetical protein